MHVLCIFSTNLTLGIRTKDFYSMVRSRKPVVVPIECPNPKPWLPTCRPKVKVPEPPLQLVNLIGYTAQRLPQSLQQQLQRDGSQKPVAGCSDHYTVHSPRIKNKQVTAMAERPRDESAILRGWVTLWNLGVTYAFHL